MTITFRPASIAENFDTVREIMQANWNESGLSSYKLALRPDLERYVAMEQMGLIFCIAAYDGDAVIGYSLTFVTHHLHTSDTCFAANDVIFLAEEFRHGRAGLALVRATEAEAQRRGCGFMVWNAKSESPFAKMLNALGYEAGEMSFIKRF